MKNINVIGNRMTRNGRKMTNSKSCLFNFRTDFQILVCSIEMKIPKKYKTLSPGSIRLQIPNKSVPVSRAGYNPIGFRRPINPSDSQFMFYQRSGGFPFSWFFRLFVKSYLQVIDLQNIKKNPYFDK